MLEASARVVGIPSAAIASLTMYSRRLASLGHPVARENLHTLRCGKRSRIEPEMPGEFLVQPNQTWRGDGSGAAQRIAPAAGHSYRRMQRNRLPRLVPSCQFQRAAFETGKIDNIESRLMRRLKGEGRPQRPCYRSLGGASTNS